MDTNKPTTISVSEALTETGKIIENPNPSTNVKDASNLSISGKHSVLVAYDLANGMHRAVVRGLVYGEGVCATVGPVTAIGSIGVASVACALAAVPMSPFILTAIGVSVLIKKLKK